MRPVALRMLLTVAVVLLIRQPLTTGLRAEARPQGLPPGAVAGPPRPTFEVGAPVPALKAIGLDGKDVVIDYGSTKKPTVLYFITPNGPFVTTNATAFSSLVMQAKDSHRFVVVSGRDDGLPEYAEQMKNQWPGVLVVGGVQPDMKKAIKMGGYPRTLVVSPEGKTLLCIEGTYQGEQAAQIERYFKIRLQR